VNIYRPLNATGYEIVNPKTLKDLRVLDFDGSSVKEAWVPPHVYRVRPTKRGANKAADLPFYSNSLVMRRSALDALHDVLDAYGEVLPLRTDDNVELFVLNIRVVIDALDVERSAIKTIPETDIVIVREHVFIESALRGVEMFRVPLVPHNIYFSDLFVERVKAAKLKGTDFIKLWSSA
jgi:hypothetical protein